MSKCVVVAMSGGVDSSVAAYLLQREGYKVIGISLKFYDAKETPGLTKGNLACCGIRGIDDAREVAYKLGIPFYALNYVEEFEEKVVSYFSREYITGRTPNPCVMCNEKIKFDSLLTKAKALGAEYIATGHYARIKYDGLRKRYVLKKGKDKGRDQSYFLFSLSQEALKYSIFPVGNYTKTQVRSLARKIGIKVHDKAASQEVCFIPDNNYKTFLIRRFPTIAKPGAIVNTKGEILGQHKGIAFYTVGQRKGLGIAHKEALYVLSVDGEKNQIVVGEEKQTYSRGLIASNVNWVSTNTINKPLKAIIKIRHNDPPAPAIITKLDKNKVRLGFIKPQKSVTPGQAAVFYDRDTVIGGGIIEKAIL